MIPYGRQSISEEDIAAVTEVLRSDFLTQGPAIEKFEAAVADYCGARHAVAMSSGTAALHAACHAAGLGPGDLLWTVPITFVASANCGRYCGANVDFVDVDPATLTMDVGLLAEKLERARRRNRLPSVVVPVHFGGLSANMAAIHNLAEEFGFAVIEDAAHALGGRYQSSLVGCCDFSDMTMFSFHPVKSITTGEGGLITTNDDELAVRLRRFRTHGITRESISMIRASEGPWYYEQIELGFNYRITDLQAALGTSQLQRLDQFVSKRAELAERYHRLLGDLPVRWQAGADGAQSAWHLFVVGLEEGAPARNEVFARLRDKGVGVNVHYIPVHLQPYYRGMGFHEGDFPASESYYDGALTLPLYPGMTEVDQDSVVRELTSALAGARGAQGR